MFMNFDLSALRICNNMNALSKRMDVCMLRLSTGKRINSAADDAAGLSISQKMESQIRGLRMASRNVQDGISMVQVAEGSLNEVHSILQRMREITVQAANDTNGSNDRTAIKDEMDQLVDELKRITKSTNFNEKNLLDGSASNINLQVGPNAGDSVSFGIDNLNDVISNLGTIDVSSHDTATAMLGRLDGAIKSVSRSRSKLGAIQNRLEGIVRMNDNYSENLEAAQSRIMDADMAAEMMEYSKVSVLQQVNIALLSQVNAHRQWILKLFDSLK